MELFYDSILRPPSLVILPVLLTSILFIWIVANILKQLVRVFHLSLQPYSQDIFSYFKQFAPANRLNPPIVFHWIPIIGSTISYGRDPLKFLAKCRQEVNISIHLFLAKHFLIGWNLAW